MTGVTPVGILPFHKKPEPEVMRIFTVFVVVETGFVVVVSVIEVFSVVDFSVEITCGITVFWLLFPLELTTFSRPILAKTFSEGVIGNIIKNTRIIPVSRINPMQEAIVTFVDLFRFDINPDFLLILSPYKYYCQIENEDGNYNSLLLFKNGHNSVCAARYCSCSVF